MRSSLRDVQLSEVQGSVRNITAGRGNLLLIATTHNMILQGSFELKFSPIVEVSSLTPSQLQRKVVLISVHNQPLTI